MIAFRIAAGGLRTWRCSHPNKLAEREASSPHSPFPNQPQRQPLEIRLSNRMLAMNHAAKVRSSPTNSQFGHSHALRRFQPRGISAMDGFHPWRIALAQFATLQKLLAHANVFGAHGDVLVPECVVHDFFDRCNHQAPDSLDNESR
jgi:hypothetical protein